MIVPIGRTRLALISVGFLALVAVATILILDLGSGSVTPNDLPVVQIGDMAAGTDNGALEESANTSVNGGQTQGDVGGSGEENGAWGNGQGGTGGGSTEPSSPVGSGPSSGGNTSTGGGSTSSSRAPSPTSTGGVETTAPEGVPTIESGEEAAASDETSTTTTTTRETVTTGVRVQNGQGGGQDGGQGSADGVGDGSGAGSSTGSTGGKQ